MTSVEAFCTIEIVSKRFPFIVNFAFGNCPKSPGTKSGEYDVRYDAISGQKLAYNEEFVR